MCSLEPLGTLEVAKGAKGVPWIGVGMSTREAVLRIQNVQNLDLVKSILILNHALKTQS